MSIILTGDDIRDLLHSTPPLLEGILGAEEQIQPNGIDLTVKAVSVFSSSGNINYENKTRVLSATTPIPFGDAGAINLQPGSYLITYNEIVHLPMGIMALGFPRSSILRCGVSIHTAVWDAGYSGRSQSLLVVHNARGFCLHRNARVTQLVFFYLEQEVGQGYQGIFQGENI